MHRVAWGYSYRYLWAIHSSCYGWPQIFHHACSLMIIPVMVLLSSLVRSMTLWRLSKLSKKKLSSNKRRRSKWYAILDHLRSTFKNVALMLNIQCLVLHNRTGLRRGGIAHFLIWCNVCLLIPHCPSLHRFHVWGY